MCPFFDVWRTAQDPQNVGEIWFGPRISRKLQINFLMAQMKIQVYKILSRTLVWKYFCCLILFLRAEVGHFFLMDPQNVGLVFCQFFLKEKCVISDILHEGLTLKCKHVSFIAIPKTYVKCLKIAIFWFWTPRMLVQCETLSA